MSRPGSGVVDVACARGFGTAGTPLSAPSQPRFGRYSAGQQPCEPVPLRLSRTRSDGTRGTASRDHLCLITGLDHPRRWVVPDVRQELPPLLMSELPI